MNENLNNKEAKKVCALLLDTKSIQKYIFSSNKLKLNIAASYLVRTIFDEIMPEILKEYGLKNENWQESNEIEMAAKPNDIECEIAYAGGGNMLILVNKGNKEKNEDTAREIVKKWTRELLLKVPGIKTGAAIGEINLSSQISNEEIKPLFTQLKQNQNEIFPNVKLPYTGLTVECAYTGDSADYYYDEKDSKSKYFSAEAISKLEALEKAKLFLKYEIKYENRFKDTELSDFLQKNGLYFTDSIEDLGQQTGEEYVAIVHIDGNNMGVKFNDCKTLQDRKKKSLEISRKTRDAFNKLIKQIVKEYDYLASNDILKLKTYLPIRPIIIGGDDITFVCPAKTAVIFAKRFMDYLYEGDGFSSCAGIVIIPTKYPFFRAYQLAEELCGAAKKESREKENPNDSDEIKRKKAKGSSWLDFAILHGEQEASLEQIRQNEYKGALGDMHFGPYYVKGYTENPKNNEKNIEKLIRGALALDKMPKNKVKLLRDIIGKDESEIKLFVEQLEHLGQQTYLESANEKYAKNIWINKETPYLDMIELMDFIYDEKVPTGNEAKEDAK